MQREIPSGTTLITGVSGFVGRTLARRLLGLGHHIVGVDLHPASELEGMPNYSFQRVDLTDPASVQQLDLSRPDHIIHLAAAGVKAAGRSWPLCTRVNLEGTANLINYLLRSTLNPHSSLLSPPRKVPPPLFLYTQTWYEDHFDTCEGFRDNPYIATKHATSRWIETISPTFPGPVVMAKVFQVYGPGDDPNNVLTYAARCLKHNQPASFGSGAQLRDWIYIDDFIDGLIACLTPTTPGLHRYDLGSGQTHTLRAMVEHLADLARHSLPDCKPTLTFDPSKDRGDTHITGRAHNLPPGWQPVISTTQGLTRLLASIP